MYWLDTTILVTLAVGAGMGFWSGLLWQVARVLSLGLSLYGCIALNEPAAALLGEHLLNGVDPRLTRGIAYVVVFLAVYLLLFAVTRLLQKSIQATKLETADRLLGAVLGAAKMTVVVAGACALIAAIALPTTREWMEKSTLAPLFAKGTEAAIAMVPEQYRHQAGEGLQQVREAVGRQAVEQVLDAGSMKSINSPAAGTAAATGSPPPAGRRRRPPPGRARRGPPAGPSGRPAAGRPSR